MVRGLKFLIKKVEEFYYLCSKNIDTDQLSGYCVADLRLCFRIYKKQVFSGSGSTNLMYVFGQLTKETLIVVVSYDKGIIMIILLLKIHYLYR